MPTTNRYDLLVTGGHVLDPGQGLDTQLDIAVRDGVVAAVVPAGEIAESAAVRVIDMSGKGRYVVPGLLDIHTHVAYGATTAGVGMECCDPDVIGVESGVTTVLDAGSVGVANVGAMATHVIPRSRTRVLTYLNIGTFAHSTANRADVTRLAEVDAEAIRSCLDHNPGLVQGFKLRLVGPLIPEAGEHLVRMAVEVARAHGLPLMVHIGDLFAPPDADRGRYRAVTEYLLGELGAGDILTHLCTPNLGGVAEAADRMEPVLLAARERGVILDSALGLGNFGYRVARLQRERGLVPDTISSDLTGRGMGVNSLTECMAKFMAIGYSLTDVVRMTTSAAASAVGLAQSAGAIAVGREADLTVVDMVEGEFAFVDTVQEAFTGPVGIVPVQTIRRGELIAPRWGTRPWGWLPKSAAVQR